MCIVALSVKFHATGKLQDLEFLDNTVVLVNTTATVTQGVVISEPVESISGLRNKPEIVNLAIRRKQNPGGHRDRREVIMLMQDSRFSARTRSTLLVNSRLLVICSRAQTQTTASRLR